VSDAVATTAEVTIDDFQRIQLRIGTVRRAEVHPKADRLVVLSVDLGEPEERQIVAGIRATHAPEDLVGRQVVVVANLRPVLLRGVESRGMLLAASDEQGLALVQPASPLRPGAIVK
jgi:methionyl-tRNA synthetase